MTFKKSSIETINSSANSLLNIINDILDFSKIEEGKITLEEIPTCVYTELLQLLSLSSGLISSKEVEIKEEGLKQLEGKAYKTDPVKVKQILLNLLSNAIKFTEKGSITISVEEHKRSSTNHSFSIHIQDTGIGISEEAQSTIFSPFQQEDASTCRKFGGTGLGLSISYELAKLLGGNLSVKSTKGKGSTFSLFLDLEIIDAENVSNPVDDIDLTWSKSPKILLVEDNKTNQKLVQILLSKLSLHSELAEDGNEAFQLYTENTYDLILMDCQMPNLNGFDCTEKIRKFEKDSGRETVPIVALTANTMTGDREKCFKAGMNDFISKPIEKNQLKRSIAQWLSSFLS